MKLRKLDATLSLLRRVARSPRLQPEQLEDLKRSIKELSQVRRSGKLDQQKVFRASARVAKVLLEITEETDTATESLSDNELKG